MSAAAAAPETQAADAAPAKVGMTGKKKLMILVAAVLVLLAAGGAGATWYVMKKRAAAAAEAEQGGEAAEATHEKAVRPTAKSAPTFMPLEPFTVNLADRDAERYAQVGMTLELADAKAGDLLKAYMPAIRNNILLALASKNAGELMEHEGKLKLAHELRAAALKPLGYTLAPQATAGPGAERAPAPDDEDPPPIRALHFSNFIIQ